VRKPASLAFVGCTGVWALLLGLIGILIHEFEDRDNDLRSGIATFATRIDFRSVRLPMAVFYAGELIAFAGMAAALFHVAPAIACAALFFFAATCIKLIAHWPHYSNYQQDGTAIQWWQLSHPFYEAYLPLAAALQCAWNHPGLFAFPLLQLAVFAPAFRGQLMELEEVFRQFTAWMTWGGRLDVDPSARASAWPLFLPRLGTRVAIRRSGSALWNVRLARPGVRVLGGAAYQVRFKVRSDRSRSIMFGVWQDHAPYQALGHCEQLQVTTEWQTVWRTFSASSDERRGYFGFWMGGEAGSVDVWRCSVRPLASKDSIG
jgi:hypothetical protein